MKDLLGRVKNLIRKEMECPEYKYELPAECPKKMFSAGYEEGEYGLDYFRITKNNPPAEEDFVPHYFLRRKRGLRKKLEKSGKVIDLCRMAGLSVLQNQNEAIRLMKKYPQLGRYIWKGTIKEEHGLLLRTSSKEWPSHYTFYACKGIKEKSIFNENVRVA